MFVQDLKTLSRFLRSIPHPESLNTSRSIASQGRTSETRTINGVGTYPLSYSYNLAGALTNITDSFGVQVGYNYDSAGRVAGVTGANFAGVSTYASNLQYRAWGALKHLDYGNSKTLDTGFNARLRPASFTVPGVMSKTYDYQADGSLKFSHDLVNAKFDRAYAHDHAGRITQALSGAEARNEGFTDLRPYNESFVYDPFGHLVERPSNQVWSGQGGEFQPWQQSYQNNRNVNWQYDADGNLVSGGNVQYTIDAASRASTVNSLTYIPYNGNPYSTIWGVSADTTQGYDGDGQIIRKVVAETTHHFNEQGNETTTATTELIRSSVLGGKVVTEINSETGQRGFVYLGNEVLAWQVGASQSVKWEHRDPHNASFRLTWSTGSIYTTEKAELDPLGTNAGTADPTTVPSLKKLSLYPGWGDAIMRGDTECMLDGMLTSCSVVNQVMERRSAALEYLIHDRHGWSTQQYPIEPLGLGMFVTEMPVFRNGTNEGPGQYLDTKELIFNFMQQNLAPLPNKQGSNLKKATDALASKLAWGVSEDCQENVIDKLKSLGFDLDGFINFLGNNPQFFNGVTSTAPAAGTVSPKQPADILYGKGATIAGVFKGSGNTRPNALTSITSPTFLSFLRPDAITGSGIDTQGLIFHEGIHGFTGKVDADIQNALGIKETPVSQNITDYIRRHCF